MAFRWRADCGPTLNAGSLAWWNYRGSGPVLLRNPLFLGFFRGGADPLSPSGSALAKLGSMCLAQWHNPMTPVRLEPYGLSVSSQALYHWATALPEQPVHPISLISICIVRSILTSYAPVICMPLPLGIRDKAALKYQDLTYDVSPQCRACAEILISRLSRPPLKELVWKILILNSVPTRLPIYMCKSKPKGGATWYDMTLSPTCCCAKLTTLLVIVL